MSTHLENAKTWVLWAFSCAVLLLLLSFAIEANAASRNASKPFKIKKSSVVKFERMPAGQYTIDAYVNNQGPFRFMIDTAATRTSLFGKTARRLGIDNPDGKTRLVNGMIISDMRPVTKVQSLIFASRSHKDHEIVILDDWPDDEIQLDGILGLDVLDGLILRFRHKDQKLFVKSRGDLDMQRFRRWTRIRLGTNPYRGEDYGLKFTIARLGERFIPTMIDTGASFTAINWAAVRGTFLDKEKRRLRHDWEVNGANGTFTPKLRIKVETLGIGGLYLRQPEILLMDFNELPINNYGKYPLLIAGTDLFDDRDFILDFKNNLLLVAPKKKHKNSKTDTSASLDTP